MVKKLLASFDYLLLMGSVVSVFHDILCRIWHRTKCDNFVLSSTNVLGPPTLLNCLPLPRSGQSVMVWAHMFAHFSVQEKDCGGRELESICLVFLPAMLYYPYKESVFQKANKSEVSC